MTTVSFNIKDFTSQPWAVKNLKIQPTGSTLIVSSSYIILNDAITSKTNVSGAITLSMAPGLYKCDTVGTSPSTNWYMYVQDGVATANAKDLVVSASYAQQIMGYETTASLAHTASYVKNAVSSAYATNAGYASTAGTSTTSTTASLAYTASYATLAATAVSSTTATIAGYSSTAGSSLYSTTAGSASCLSANSIKIGFSPSNTLGFFGGTGAARQNILTYPYANVTASLPIAFDANFGEGNYGFSSSDEFRSCMSIILNLQQRVTQLESFMLNYGLAVLD